MYSEDGLMKDDEGRTLILRGVNLGGSSKIPKIPDGATYRMRGFFDHKDVSFVGRPFPLEEADEHFQRLETWGLYFIRLVVTWEAIEHAGPGKYDTDYLDYLEALTAKAAEYGLNLSIDPHQDVWSRWTGGDGAPAWTLEAIGMDPTNMHQTGAALLHNHSEGSYPAMIWPTNYTRFGAATMFTLFFGGHRFAPLTRINNVPVQDYLQNHYINAFKEVALRLRRFSNIVGFGCMNEPHPGFIGHTDLNTHFSWELKNGITPTPFQSMLSCSGIPQHVDKYSFSLLGARKKGEKIVNKEGVPLWKPGKECVWKRNGVWSLENFTPRLLKPHYFERVNGASIDFANDFLKPFLKRFYQSIVSAVPSTYIFVEGVPGEKPPRWNIKDGSRIIYTAHWYDNITLMTKRYHPRIGHDAVNGRIVFGKTNVYRSFVDQLHHHKTAGKELLSNAPTLIGEFGLPFDLKRGRAYNTNDFSDHIRALDTYYSAMDENLLGCTIWNYTSDNTNRYGDQWNGEDLSIFSKDQQDKPEEINSGGRAVSGFCRPYAYKIAGTPLMMKFDLRSREFVLTYTPNLSIEEPSEIFVPRHHYPEGYAVNISAGSFRKDQRTQRLFIYHSYMDTPHSVIIKPPR